MFRQTNIQKECIDSGNKECQIHMFNLHHNSLPSMKHLGKKEAFKFDRKTIQGCIHSHSCRANSHHFPCRLICCIMRQLHMLETPCSCCYLKLGQYSTYHQLLISYSKRRCLKSHFGKYHLCSEMLILRILEKA